MPVTVRFDPTANSIQAQVIPDAGPNNDGVMSAAMFNELNDPAGQIPDASTTTRGLMTPAQVDQLNLALAETNVNLFADPVNGNDANDGLTPATAVQTLAKAMSLCPAAMQGASNRLTLLNDGVTQSVFPLNSPECLNAGLPVGGQATPLIIQSALIPIQSATDSVGDPTGNVVTVAAPTFVPGAFVGNTLRCLTGANAGLTRFVKGNTSTTIEANIQFPNAIAIGDTFQVQIPGANITNAGELCIGAGPLGLIGVKLSTGFARSVRCNITFAHCEWDLSGGIVIFETSGLCFQGGGLNHQWDADPTDPWGTSNSVANFGAGLYAHDGLFITDLAMNQTGFLVASNLTMRTGRVGGGNTITLFSPVAVNGSNFLMNNLTNFYIKNDQAGFSHKPGSFDSSSLSLNGRCYLQVSGGSDFSNAPGDAIFLDGGSYGNIPGVTGVGNAGVGCHVQGQSQAEFDGATTVTGAGGDTLVGAVVKAWVADLTPNGFSETNAGGPTLNRIAPIGV